MMLTEFIIFIFYVTYAKCSTELPSWHLKPLGSHIKPDNVYESYLDNIISPSDFAEQYVLPRKPTVFRNVVKEWPAFKLWTDEYLAEQYGELELRIEGKKEKQSGVPKGDVCLGRDRMKTFLKEYKQGANKYVVSDLPTPMWHEVFIPPSMACGEFLENFVETDIWINSDLGKKGEGGNSMLHKDAFNTINCVINGTKEWKLIELQYNDYVYQSWEGPMDKGYGGFSLINTEKVDAKKFPNVGKIPRWQFTTINAGDCLYLPSQTWHQVKSYGDTNRAVAFLFSQFHDAKQIETKNCSKHPKNLPLSNVDVDLRYPGYGEMVMGNFELKEVHRMLEQLVSKKKSHVTKRNIFKLVLESHSNGAINKDLIIKKSKSFYEYLLELANNEPKSMDQSFIDNLSRDQLRHVYQWLFPMEPANSYLHEYGYILPEDIIEIIEELTNQYNDELTKEKFLDSYQETGGTLKFAKELWVRLAGEKDRVIVTDEVLKYAVEKYEYYRRDKLEVERDDEETITTPQGHKSQPRKFEGGYTNNEYDNEEKEKHVEL